MAVSLIALYLTYFAFMAVKTRFPYYGQDFLAFWSVGKIADEKGYAGIYILDNLRMVEVQEMVNLGILDPLDSPDFAPIPAPYLSFFVFPFQLLSKIDVQTSSTIWLITNFLLLIGYLSFYYLGLRRDSNNRSSSFSLLLIILFSYPVFDNFMAGQINVWLLIFIGEFIRNSLKNKPFIAGFWLGGLLLKPQLLILIAPVLLILRYWKSITGFMISSAVILVSSWLLSGTNGILELVSLLTKYSAGLATNSPEFMINWRMIGINLNSLTHSSLGWIITAIGMLVTLAIVVYLISKKPTFGSPEWGLMILGIFSGTLAFTWHSHNHTMMIMIPLLYFATLSGLLTQKQLFAWVLIPSISWISSVLIWVLLLFSSKSDIYDFRGWIITFSGFLANQVILISILCHYIQHDISILKTIRLDAK